MNERNRHAPLAEWERTKKRSAGMDDQTITQKNGYRNKDRDSLKPMKAVKQWNGSANDGKNGKSSAPLDIFGKHASVKDPKTWNTYENCKRSRFPSVGFVLTDNDPYTIIDLDDKLDNPATPEQKALHQKIIDTFDSYTERSVSGRGYHIIVKGRVPKGVKSRDKVEVYSSDRYMIVTEDVVVDKPIADRQQLLDQLCAELGTPAETVELVQDDSNIDDSVIIDTARKARNGDKFSKLFDDGDWQRDYPSQSEADLALLSILAFYTKDNAQVKRLFRMSALGKRSKAQREDYLNRSLQKIRAHEVTPVETEHIKKELEKPVAQIVETSNDKPQGGSHYSYPPGFLGEIAAYITNSAIRSIRELGIIAALALAAGLWGRAYNVSGTGLNLYLIFTAKSGTGKSGLINGIERLFGAMGRTLPTIYDHMGPCEFASGQSLFQTLSRQPCFLTIIGEVGHWLKRLVDKRANTNQILLQKAVLDMYSKSGYDNMLQPFVYADSAKNTKIIRAPCLTILGEGIPDKVFEEVNDDLFNNGLIPRCVFVQYKGKRLPINPEHNSAPPKKIVERLIEITTSAFRYEQAHRVCDIGLTKDANRIMCALDRRYDDMINATDNGPERNIWNRAHLNALKIASLCAVANNHKEPTIGVAEAQWAVDFVTYSNEAVLQTLASGAYSTGNARQEADLRQTVEDYLTLTLKKRKSYRMPRGLINAPRLIPYVYLWCRLRGVKSFSSDRKGSTDALKALLKELVTADILIKLPEKEIFEKYGTRAVVYVRGPQW